MTPAHQNLLELLTEGRTACDLLRIAEHDEPGRVYAVDPDGSCTVGELAEGVRTMRTALRNAGVREGSRVAVALGNSIEHIVIVFAVFQLGAIWVPLNTRLKGLALRHQMVDAGVAHVVAGPASELASELAGSFDLRDARITGPGVLLPVRPDAPEVSIWFMSGAASRSTPASTGHTELAPDVVSVMYTSGTTGPAKGVQVTDSMLLASAFGCIETTEPRPGDVFYVWEPLFHIGGAQLMVLPLLAPISLALSKGFSTSRFWQEAAEFGATHIHHLGGVLQMLLNRAPHDAERGHSVRLTWGAGATAAIWETVEQRFAIKIHECYGMTETSSIVTVNKEGPQHGIGRPLPWFDVSLAPRNAVDDAGTGELLVRSATPGLLTPGYLNQPAATARAWSGDWWNTGDVVRLTETGDLLYIGRGNDSLRVRGENVSAWQVESIFDAHPDVDQCAAIGVQAEVGEQEIQLVVLPVEGVIIDPVELVSWAKARMPAFHIPRYVRVVASMPLTPSRRVAKRELPTDLDGVIDLRKEREASR